MAKALNYILLILVWQIVVLLRPFALNPRDIMQIVALDVGQGDAFLVTTPDQFTMLVDTGKEPENLARALSQHLYKRDIDLLILTHPDQDHIGGVAALFGHFGVKAVFWPDSQKHDAATDGIASHIFASASHQKIPIYQVNNTHDFRLGCCTHVDVLWPLAKQDTNSETESNQISTVVRVGYNKFSFWMGGDLGGQAEEAVVQILASQYSEVDVFKLGHHGSRTSSSETVLQGLGGSVAMVSVGADNPYGHPHPEVLQNLEKLGIPLWRTDVHGSVSLVTNGLDFFRLTSNKTLEQKEYKI